MPVMERLRFFVAQEPVVAASCLIAGVGLYLPFFLPILIASALNFEWLDVFGKLEIRILKILIIRIYFVY